MEKMRNLKRVMVVIIVAMVLTTGLNVITNHNQEDVQAAKVSKKLKKISKNCHKYFDYKKGNKKFIDDLTRRIDKVYGNTEAWSLTCKSNKIVIEVE